MIRQALDAALAGPYDTEATARSLNRRDISAAVDTVADRAPIHANRMRAYLHAFFEWAIEKRAMDANPARAIQPLVVEAPRSRLLSVDEIAEILNAARLLDYPFGPAIQLLILTGALREEVAGLRMTDLRYDEALGALIWTIRPKQKDPRQHHAIPLSFSAASVIADNPRRPEPVGLVFTTTGTTPISGWSRAKRRLDGLVNAARSEQGREPMDPWRLNDLRAAFAYHSAETLGEYEFFIERCLGKMKGLSSKRAPGLGATRRHSAMEA